jgi:hypothetical protein
MSLGYDPELPNGFQDADFEMREMEAQGREHRRKVNRSQALRDEGKWDEAAEACPHSGGYSSPSKAAERADDPRKDEKGFRCGTCGSFLSGDPWEDYTIIAACEIEPYI